MFVTTSLFGNATLGIFDVNSTSTVPTFQNRLTIDAGRTLTMTTGKRCKIQGTLLGQGTMKISYPYVRGDFSMNTSAFEGTLHVTGGQFRIVAATDLSKATMRLDAGVYAVHAKSQSGDEQDLTTKIGSLQSSAADAQLSTGTWNVGYLGRDDVYAGRFTGALNKYGTGRLTLTGSASTGALTIYEGTLGIGTSATAGATFTHVGPLSVRKGAALAIKVQRTSTAVRCDALDIAGRVTLVSPTIAITLLGNNALQAGDELHLFTGSGAVSLSGTPVITVSGSAVTDATRPAPGLKWDTTRLASDGILAVAEDPDAITAVGDDRRADQPVYDLGGRRVSSDARQALPSRRGIYVVGGHKKVVVK